MDLRQMARRCRGARSLGPARLPNHTLTFTWDSHIWEGGVGHVVAEPGHDVWGVLWDCTDDHITSLDGYERLSDGIYIRTQMPVEHDGAPTDALIYLACGDTYKAPSKRYVRTLVRGARANGLPADYIAELEALL